MNIKNSEFTCCRKKRFLEKTVLAVDIVKAIQKNRKLKQGKVGIVTAESLNKKDVSHIIEKLHGGAIIIERASKLSKKTVMELNDLMEEQTGELLVVLEEERRPLDKMLALYPSLRRSLLPDWNFRYLSMMSL